MSGVCVISQPRNYVDDSDPATAEEDVAEEDAAETCVPCNSGGAAPALRWVGVYTLYTQTSI